MRFILPVLFCFTLSACVTEQNIQQQLNSFKPNLSAFNATEKEMHGIKIKVNHCSISSTRVATCSMTAMSKFQDRKLSLLGGSYTTLQDDTGLSYSSQLAFGEDATNRGQRVATLIADTPYNFTIMAENISTKATKVRAINIERMDVSVGVGKGFIGYIAMNFPNPPVGGMQGGHESVVEAPSEKILVQKNSVTYGGDAMAYRYLFVKIVAINENIPVDPLVKSLLGNGVYLYLNENGSIGHNFAKPGPYVYTPGEKWILTQDELVISFTPDISYSFDLPVKTQPMVTYLDQGGLFKMSAYIKRAKQK